MGNTTRKIKLVALLIMIFTWITMALANSAGAPTSNTGAPGERNCTDCHSTNPLNTGGGSVTITGLPQNYVPGTKYSLTVTVSKTGQMRWGFQVTALTADNSNAGTFTITDGGNTQMQIGSVGGKTRNYVGHNLNGTQRGKRDSASFIFDWTAPTSNVGTVSFYLAGNAANGDSTLVNDFIYTAKVDVAPMATGPTLTAINPNRGPASGGTTVTLTGTNFRNATTVTFDGISAPTTVVDDKTLMVVTPAHAAGSVDVIASNPDGQNARLRNGFTYEAAQGPLPSLTNITPNTGPTAGGTAITLTGSNFVSGLTVMVGTRQAMMVNATATQITAVTPPGNPGMANVVVTNPDGQAAVLANAFVYVGDPTIPGVLLLTPNGGETLSSGGFPFIINWMQNASPTATQRLELSTDGGNTFSTVIADNLTADKSSFVYSVPSGITSTNARIRISFTDNGAVVSDVSDQNFTIVSAPIITSIKPTVAATIKLKITGQNFKTGTLVEVNGNTVTTTVKSGTVVVAKKLPRSLAGTQIRIRIMNPDGGISAEMLITP